MTITIDWDAVSKVPGVWGPWVIRFQPGESVTSEAPRLGIIFNDFVVHHMQRYDEGPSPFRVSHVPTGYRVTEVYDLEHAALLAATLAHTFTNWGSDPEQIKADVTAKAAVIRIKAEVARRIDNAFADRMEAE